jgi:hypothetical protein
MRRAATAEAKATIKNDRSPDRQSLTALQFLFHGDLNSVSRSIRDARGKERQMEYQHLICFDWRIEHPWCYVGSAFVFCVFVRAILSLFSAAQLSYIHKMSFMDGFCGAMIGWVDRHNRDEKNNLRERSDFLSSFVLGLMELLAFPILFATSLVTVIGVWIGFKAVAQWSTWKEQRFTFNRFLLGNVLVVMLSYALLWFYVNCPVCAVSSLR